MAGLAAVTHRIRLFASVTVLTIPPPIVARMAVTIDSISHGRFGINIVSGWHAAEYSQMGLWPGDTFFGERYDYSTEYVRVLRELWNGGRSDFKGRYFQMDDCRLLPKPSREIEIVSAGQSDRGMQFTAEYGNYAFCLGSGLNTPTAHAATNASWSKPARVPARCRHLCAGHGDRRRNRCGGDGEMGALQVRHRREGAELDVRPGWGRHHRVGKFYRKVDDAPKSAINFNMGTLVGSYASVARMLDEMAAVTGHARHHANIR